MSMVVMIVQQGDDGSVVMTFCGPFTSSIISSMHASPKSMHLS